MLWVSLALAQAASTIVSRHREERSDEAIQEAKGLSPAAPGSRRCARDDEEGESEGPQIAPTLALMSRFAALPSSKKATGRPAGSGRPVRSRGWGTA